MKKYLFAAFLVVSLVFVTGCKGSNSTISSSKKGQLGQECLTTGQEMMPDSRVKARIMVIDGVDQEEFKEKLTVEDLKNLQYGQSSKQTSEGYYVAYEICDVDSNEVIEEGWYEINDERVMTKYDPDSEIPSQQYESTGGNYTNFVYSVEDEERVAASEPGNYALNVFILPEGEKDWVWVAQRTFEVI